MEFDALTLARLQFAFTVSFHIIFPAFTIGLASYLAVLEALWLYTGRDVYLTLFNYWKKIFAISFGMGVVSGIVMSYQFGTNWSVFSDKTGPVIGPADGLRGDVRLLPRGRLPRRHAVRHGAGRPRAAFLRHPDGRRRHAALGLLDPVGQQLDAHARRLRHQRRRPVHARRLVGGRSSIPSFPYRLVHMVLAAYLTTAFVVGAVGAWHLLRDRANERARVMFSMAMWMAALVAPIQIVAGDQHGLNTLEHQPAKIAAMEGHWETRRGPAADPVRLAGHGRGDDALRHRDSQARQLHPHARLERRGEGPQGLAARRPAQRARSCSGASASWSASAC